MVSLFSVSKICVNLIRIGIASWMICPRPGHTHVLQSINNSWLFGWPKKESQPKCRPSKWPCLWHHRKTYQMAWGVAQRTPRGKACIDSGSWGVPTPVAHGVAIAVEDLSAQVVKPLEGRGVSFSDALERLDCFLAFMMLQSTQSVRSTCITGLH